MRRRPPTPWPCRPAGVSRIPARIARAALALSAVRQQTGQHEAAIPLAEEGAGYYRSLADRSGEAAALDQMGQAHQRTGRSREALADSEEARILYRAAVDSRGVADTLSHSGITCGFLGRYPEGQAQMREALALYRDAWRPARGSEGAQQSGPGPAVRRLPSGRA